MIIPIKATLVFVVDTEAGHAGLHEGLDYGAVLRSSLGTSPIFQSGAAQIQELHWDRWEADEDRAVAEEEYGPVVVVDDGRKELFERACAGLVERGYVLTASNVGFTANEEYADNTYQAMFVLPGVLYGNEEE